MNDKSPHSFARSKSGRSYTLLVLAMVVTALLTFAAPLWVSVIYGGFLICLLVFNRGVRL